MSIDSIILLTQRLVAIGIIIQCLESLLILKQYKAGGIFDWEILRTARKFTLNAPTRNLFDFIFSYNNYIVIIAIQITTSLLLFLNLSAIHPVIAPSICLLCLILNNIRHTVGTEGSDQMTVIVVFSLVVIYATSILTVKYIAVAFIASQLFLSYVIAGIAKLISEPWRSGKAFTELNQSESFGHKKLFSFLNRNQRTAKHLSRLIISMEIILPFLMFLGTPYVYLFLLSALIFHFSVAVTMKLNCFLWAFSSAMPSAYFISAHFFS